MGATLSATGGVAVACSKSTENASKAKRALRVAHITDVHIRPEHNAMARFKTCLQQVKSHKPDFFLNGGDAVFAVDYDHITRERTNELWKCWHDSTKEIAEYPMYSCLGNHDMWWAAPDKSDPMYGKDYALKQLNMPKRHYSFDQAGWHFIMLDGNNDPYPSQDSEQFEWLKKDFDALPEGTPVLIMSHFPIIGAATTLNGGSHQEKRELTDLFHRHQDKKITCLSGHLHLHDKNEHINVHYFCNGAVSGYWWEDGNNRSGQKYWHEQTPPGFAILDLFEDGSVKNTYYAHG